MKKRDDFVLAKLLAVALVLGTLGLAGTAGAVESRRGFYAGVELGFANAADLNSTESGINHPTRCDQRLISTPPAPATDNVFVRPSQGYTDNCQTVTDAGVQPFSRNSFDLGAGFLGAVSAGYAFENLRLEFEYLNRSHGSDTRPFMTASGNAALGSKADEWSEIDPPSERVSEFRAHQFFLNAYYDFVNRSRWTPYLGAGAGWARTSLRYQNRFVRKTLAQGYQDPPNQDRPPNAAGTVSFLDTEIAKTLFGFQFLGGADFALAEHVSVGLKGRWARFQDLNGNDVWDLIRSHEPVQADGTTPFATRQSFENIEYWAVSVGLKYHF